MSTFGSSHDEPPLALPEPVELDPLGWTETAIYDLVVPRPVGLDLDDLAERASEPGAYSYHNLVADSPPDVAFSSIGIKHAVTNVADTREFVMNVAYDELRDALDRSAASRV